jgi:predicted  nucleic acid-binding Zn-ribbon protein
MPVGANNPPRHDDESLSDAAYTYAGAESALRTLRASSIERLEFELTHIGGIEECQFALSPGVTVLVGENATNRTSTLRGIGAAVGADTGTVRADATAATASVDVVTPDRTTTFAREYTVVDGDTVQTAFSEVAGLQKSGVDALTDFAVLLEDNRLRRAVRRDGNLYDVLMSPVDTDAIQREIEELSNRRADLEDEITEIEREREKLPALKDRVESLREEISEKSAELDSKQAELERLQAESTETESDELTETLQDRRRERNRIASSIAQEEESIGGLEDQRDETESELDALAVDEERLATLREQISTLEAQKRDLDETISSLSTLAGLNTEALEGDIDTFLDESSSTDALTPGSRQVACWTCGTSVERQTIESRTAEIQQLAADKRERRDELEARLSELRGEREDIEQTRERRATLESRLDRIESELATRRQRVSELREEKAAVSDRISELEAELDELDGTAESGGDTVAVSQEIGELEAAISQLESEYEEVSERIESVSERADSLAELTDERDAVTDRIRELRGVVERTEDELVASFNERMDELLDRLDYDNVARVWLEKKGGPDQGTEFVLNVTREDDVVYEDCVSNLSESEREIVGLMAAIVGYTVHNVGDIFPLMVLDSLEAIDASRIARLIEYLSGETEFLVAALLQEDARELPDTYTRAAPCSE